ncbi:MAG: TetR/AcrR family transcriptional regulator [Frankiaceae bacterium]
MARASSTGEETRSSEVKRALTGYAARGRHRDESRDPEILRAALEVLAEIGYDKLSMEAVAARARAGKATLYRRWPGKAELVVDAITCLHDTGEQAPIDTGSLRGDLRVLLLGGLSEVGEFEIGCVTGLMTALRRNPDLAKVFEERFLSRKLQTAREVFERASERGEVAPGHDIELLASVGPALLFHRLLLSSKPLTRHYISRVIDEVVIPLAGAPSPRKAKA